MEGAWRLLTFLAFIHTIGLYLFTTGFFLTRYELDEKSACVLDNEIPTFVETCWHEDKQYDRAILILIDALRFDFAYYNESKTEDTCTVYENKLPIMRDALRDTPAQSRLFQFAADPPTVTMQVSFFLIFLPLLIIVTHPIHINICFF